MSDVIAAVSTGNQVSAIGIIRLTGDHCAAVAGKVFTLNNKKALCDVPDKRLCLGTLKDKEGRVIDNCCAIYSRGPHSYTGEDTVEFHCHGSPAVLAAGLEALYIAGARPAKRGEFTKRAFLNGKLDLTQAEAAHGVTAAWMTLEELWQAVSSPIFQRPQGKFLQARDMAALRALWNS